MPSHATGTTEVKLTPQGDGDTAEGSTLGRMTIAKQFHGDLDGASKGEMLTAGTDVKNSAGYVAIERITGTLNGRAGSFVFQHSGTLRAARPHDPSRSYRIPARVDLPDYGHDASSQSPTGNIPTISNTRFRKPRSSGSDWFGIYRQVSISFHASQLWLEETRLLILSCFRQGKPAPLVPWNAPRLDLRFELRAVGVPVSKPCARAMHRRMVDVHRMEVHRISEGGRVHKVIIIGSGCAGLTAAIYAARADLKPLVLDGYEPGGQLALTTMVENFPGFPDGILGPELIENTRKQAQRFGTEFRAGAVSSVELGKRPFQNYRGQRRRTSARR